MISQNFLPFALVWIFACINLRAESGPEVDPARDLPRFPPVEPARALETFEIKPGLRMDLVAHEPLVADPIALTFDEDGRMYVVEMRDYSERRQEKLGRIRVLEDTNGDGVFDRSVVFAEDLAWPTALFCWQGGLFVGATPDLLYLKDTTGDGRADLRRVVFTGFGNTRERLNVQSLLNSFNWGLDNRIHGLTSGNGGIITNLVLDGKPPLDLNGRNFSFDPRTFEMRAEAGGGQYGMSFDSAGRKFASSNSDHLMAFLYEGRYGDRNPHFAMPHGLASIAVDGGAAEVYRISPDEPWRILRTRWRMDGVVSGIVEGGGRVSGYFTGASGVTIYRGNALPRSFHDNAFTGDVGGNLVHRKVIRHDGCTPSAERPADEAGVEFLASRDTWFRPVHFANAPDGALYVIDMYREVIEHPWSLPESIKKHLDLNSGHDRGRIYRIVPEHFKQPPAARLGRMSTAELVATLGHANGWHRETAARLLYERHDPAAVPLLEQSMRTAPEPFARLHALYALEGLGALTERAVLDALDDGDERVRQHAVRLSERWIRPGSVSKPISETLYALVHDRSPAVLLQLGFTLGELRWPGREEAMAALLRRDPECPWLRAAVMSGLGEGAAEVFPHLLEHSGQGEGIFTTLVGLAKMMGAGNDPEEAGKVLQTAVSDADSLRAFAMAAALSEGLQQNRSSLTRPPYRELAANLLKRAADRASDSSEREPIRLAALKLLGFAEFTRASEVLFARLKQPDSPAVQLAAVTALGRFSEPEAAAGLVSAWPSLTPRLRLEALKVLLARTDRIQILLAAIRAETIRRDELDASQIAGLREHRDPSISAKAVQILGGVESERATIIEQFTEALALNGRVASGKRIFEERCASCHRIGGGGFAVGPDMETVRNSGREKLLIAIADPNREVAPQFQSYEVETRDGEVLAGLIASETASHLRIRQSFGKEEDVPRSSIVRIDSRGRSLMPDGLEAGLSPQEMADLLEYIETGR